MNNRDIVHQILYSVTFRVAVVGVLALLLLIPVGMVRGLIYERELTRITAVSEISQRWGGQQTVAGPILSIPYRKYIISEKGERVIKTQYAHFLPETLLVDGVLKPQIRSRGIFDAVVYSSEINFSGKFKHPNMRDLGIENKDVNWGDAFISVGISDTRGIGNNIKLNWNNIEVPFRPGVQTNDVIRENVQGSNYEMEPYYGKMIHGPRVRSIPFPVMEIGQGSGISAQLPSYIKSENIHDHEFSFKLNLNGSRNLQFVPVGRTTEITLKSNWDSPSFSGAFLPYAREIGDGGFEASWKILDLNRGYPQSWLGSAYDIYSSASGVNLLAGIDGYAKTERSAKYALLIIALTFLVFFFAEVFNRKRIHPIQYILVGLSLALFYALLISISEIVGFGLAYFISSITTIGLITLYSKSVLANTKMALAQGSILAFLYLLIYIILQLEDYALLIGSILLFSILAIVMYLSRKVDWYEVGSNTQDS